MDPAMQWSSRQHL